MSQSERTPQELFDQSVGGILRQGRPAQHPEGHCMYRTLEGCKCAAGQLIPDDRYTPDLEENSCCHPKVAEAMGIPQASDEMRLVRDLQLAHDEAAALSRAGHVSFLSDFAKNAAEVGRRHGLSVAVLAEML